MEVQVKVNCVKQMEYGVDHILLPQHLRHLQEQAKHHQLLLVELHVLTKLNTVKVVVVGMVVEQPHVHHQLAQCIHL